jgi:hypothetical protein
MQFLSYDDIPPAQITQTFKNASWRSLLWVVVITGIITAYTAIPKGTPTNPALIAVPGLVTLFFAGLALWHFRLARNPRCWLLKGSEQGLYINLQSNVNVPPTEGAPAVLFVPAESVETVTRVHELRTLPTRHGQYKNNFTYFDIELRETLPDDLLVALAAIRRNPAMRGSIGLRKDFYCAVRLENQHIVRLVWDWMTPREFQTEGWFRSAYEVGDMQELRGPRWDGMSNPDKDFYIDTLWEWGDVQDAVLQKSLKDTISERAAARELMDRLG